MASLVYNKGKYLVASGALALNSADLRVLLTSSGYTANPDHDAVIDVTNELSGPGYLRKALTGLAVAEDALNDRAASDAADITWTDINAGTAAKAVVYVEGVSDTLRYLVACIDLTPPVSTNGGSLTVNWNVGGLLRLT